MPGGMGRGARGLGIDGGVVLESSLTKIVPKWDEGWKDDWGRFDRRSRQVLYIFVLTFSDT